jgi:hypothetical protein
METTPEQQNKLVMEIGEALRQLLKSMTRWFDAKTSTERKKTE